MKHIWAPWRIEYIEMEKEKGCFLCDRPKENDDARSYILYRGKENFIILNRYPYNPGHLMVAPYRHVASPEKLTGEERREHFDLVCRSVEVIRQVFATDGLNIGINLGRAAGAGLETHFHTHVVPRWSGDTNFMPVLADAKVLPEMLADTYAKLKDRF